MKNQQITVQVNVAVGIDKVWDYWTNPDHVVNWNFAISDWYCPKAENNLQKGGSFRYTMAARDGSVSFDFAGVYNEVDLNKRLDYTLDDGRKVAVLFENDGNYTTITEIFEAEEINTVELQQGGWQAILNNFKAYAEITR